jgi:hypothetical protein
MTNRFIVSTPYQFTIYDDDDVVYISAEPNEYTISMLECAISSVVMENLIEDSDIQSWMPRLHHSLLMDTKDIVPSKLIQRMQTHKKFAIRRIARYLKIIMESRDMIKTEYI